MASSQIQSVVINTGNLVPIPERLMGDPLRKQSILTSGTEWNFLDKDEMIQRLSTSLVKSLSHSILPKKKRLHFRVLRKESLEIPWPHPHHLWANQIPDQDLLTLHSGLMTCPGNSNSAREMKTNQNPTPNPSTEGNQLDVSQPGNSRFSIFSRENTLYKQCNPEFRSPLLSRCVSNGGSPSLSLVIKTLLLLHQISAPWWSLGDFETWA